MKILVVLAVVFAFDATNGDEKLGRLIRAVPKDKAQLDFLSMLADKDDVFGLDFWTHPSHIGGSVDIRVSDEKYSQLAKLLNIHNIVFTIQIIDLDGLNREQKAAGNSRSGVFRYDNYNRLDTINKEIQRLVSQAPSIASTFTVGKSYERREMTAVRLSTGSGKKTIFINCGIHAREWITPAFCMYMLREITTKYTTDSSIKALMDKVDLVIMPVLNVDGYEYTWTNNRMWRKTRSRNPGSRCMGADPNRNFNVKFGGVGTSSDPCRDTYHGRYPFSEIETRNVARYLYSIRRRLVGYMDVHAYSQLWMLPYGHRRGAYTKYHGELMRVANKAVAELKRHYGTSYRAGTSADIIYATTGGTMDWATSVLGVIYSYGLELRDKGRYGFLLPANQIMPTCVETFAAFKTMVQEMKI